MCAGALTAEGAGLSELRVARSGALGTAIEGWYVMPVARVKRSTVDMSRGEEEVVPSSSSGLVLGFWIPVGEIPGATGFGPFFFVSPEQIKP